MRVHGVQRVLINSDGDMIVRPSFIEAAVQKKSTTSVVHHLLINYQRAHVAIIKAQFTCKRLRDGMLVHPSTPSTTPFATSRVPLPLDTGCMQLAGNARSHPTTSDWIHVTELLDS